MIHFQLQASEAPRHSKFSKIPTISSKIFVSRDTVYHMMYNVRISFNCHMIRHGGSESHRRQQLFCLNSTNIRVTLYILGSIIQLRISNFPNHRPARLEYHHQNYSPRFLPTYSYQVLFQPFCFFRYVLIFGQQHLLSCPLFWSNILRRTIITMMCCDLCALSVASRFRRLGWI